MSNHKADDLIGHDPLAWIAEEEPQEIVVECEVEEVVSNSEAVKETAPEAQKVCDVEPEMSEKDSVPCQDEALEAVVKKGQAMAISFEGDLGIAQVADLHKRLSAILQTTSEFTLDMSEVSHVDTAALQVLCAFAVDAEKQGIKWQWQGMPDCIVQTANALGLSTILGLES